MAAARLADVGAGDPHPLVLRRSGQHALEQLAVAGLELGALPQLQLGAADPGRQRVAHRLQLTEVERPRLGRDRGDAGVELEAGKRLGDERAELRFEAPDLASQLRPGEPLVTIDAKRSAILSIQQIRHSPATSVDQATDWNAIVALRL